MKFGFVTCVQLGLECMEAIYAAGGELEVVITLHDHRVRKKSGRIYVDGFCQRHNIDVVKIKHVNDAESIAAIKEHDLDWLFIIGWSQIAGAHVLAAPKKGCIGMHPTLLPKGRGRAAIPWAILKGLTETGVTMFVLDEGVDTGSILAQEVIPLMKDETATSLYNKVGQAHASLITRVWPQLVADQIIPQIQDHSQATIWEGRKPEDGKISFEMSCDEIDRLVRAVTTPYPGAFIDTPHGRYIIWAGRAHEGKFLAKDQFAIEDDTALWIMAKNGSYEAYEWEKATLYEYK